MKEETAALHSEQHVHTASNQKRDGKKASERMSLLTMYSQPRWFIHSNKVICTTINASMLSIRAPSIREWVYMQSNHPCTTPCYFLLPEVLPCVTERLHTRKIYTNAVHGDRGGPL